MAENERITELQEAVDNENWDRLEELWLEVLEAAPPPVATLLEIARTITDSGHRGLARTLVELLAESMEAAGDHTNAFAALRELVSLTDKPGQVLLQRLETSFTGARAASPSLAAVRERYTLVGARKPLTELDAMSTWLDHDVGTAVELAGQGVGRVVDVNLELENIKVDLGGRRPVSVPFGAVARFMRRLPDGSFLRRKVEEPEQLALFVTSAPGDALVALLDEHDDPVDVATIKSALDGLLPPKQWTSWWSKARKHPRVLTTGTGSRLRYAVSRSAESATDALLDDLRSADPRSRLAVARRLAARGDEAATATAAFLAESLAELEESDPGLAWETVGTLTGLPGGQRPAERYTDRLLANVPPMLILTGVQDRAARLELLEAVRRHSPDDWQSTWSAWMRREESATNLSAMASQLATTDGGAPLEAAIEKIFRSPHEHPAQLIWACESMVEDTVPQALASHMTPSLLELLPDTLSRKEYAPLRARAKALLEGGKVAIRLLLEQATEQQATRFGQRVARVDSLEPDRVRLIEQAVQQCQTTTREPETPMLVATRAAVEAKRAELKQLLDHEIPKTLKGIQAAAAEGDLRENFEYHMLRDRQELQSAQAAQLQQDLARVRILEPGAADTSRVNIGTRVHLETLDGTSLKPITILGSWDADVDRRIFANGTELAEGLLEHTIGDTVKVEGADARITRIEAWPSESAG